MVNVKDKKCVEEGCIKRPSFNFPSEKKPEFCSNHKKTNMININYKN